MVLNISYDFIGSFVGVKFVVGVMIINIIFLDVFVDGIYIEDYLVDVSVVFLKVF